MKDGLIYWALICYLILDSLVQAQPVSLPDNQAAPQAYWIYFKDKDGSDFDPYTYFEPCAIERRLRLGLGAFDSLDIPVNEKYLSSLRSLADSVDMASRWLNAAYVYADQEQLAAIQQLVCVKKIEPGGRMMAIAGDGENSPEQSSLTEEQRNYIRFHTSHMQGEEFQKRGIDGSGVRIAILDAGFPDVNINEAFSDIVKDGRIIASWDFFRNDSNVYHGNQHGTMVMSLIGGEFESLSLGMAPCAEFLLARTETWRETLVEEKNWLAAAEWADKWGADIISSSLGYTFHRYFPEEMDGQTSIVSRAATIAFQKGILIVSAAGNSGNSPHWKVMASPADAPSVMAVGALKYPSLQSASYSSRGPGADGRSKPDLSALGTAYAVTKDGLSLKSGTSFACPLVAGFAACVMQLHPDWTNAQVFTAMLQSGSLYPDPDNTRGYGIPQALHFFGEGKDEPPQSLDFALPAKQPIDQEISLRGKTRRDTLLPRFGMNRANFGHFFAGFGTPAGRPENNNDQLNYAASNLIGIGYRHKRRISQTLSFASEWNIRRIAFFPRQWDGLNDPGITSWKKRKLVILQTGTALYTRINYDQARGNYVGRYFDLGGYFEWNFNIRQVYFSRGPDMEKIRTRFSHLNYLNPFEFGLLLRIGFQNIALTTTYRLSDYFRPGSGMGELPTWSIGIELGAFPF